MTVLPQSPQEDNRKANFELGGYSDVDALDVIEGFMGALTKTDVRPQYDQCYEGVPAIIDELEQVERIDFSNLLGFFSQLMVALPKEFSSCSTIVTGIPSFFIHLFTTINLALLLTNL